jgi:hypothetical protein
VDEVGKERGKDAGKCTAIDLFGVEGAEAEGIRVSIKKPFAS